MQLAWPTPPPSLKKWIDTLKPQGKFSSEQQKEVHWKAIEQARAGWYRSAARIIKERFEIERRQVIWAIKTAMVSELVRAAVDAELEAGRKNWQDAITAIYLTVGEDFARRALEGLIKGIAITQSKQIQDIWKNEVLRWLSHESSKKVTQITETTRNQIRIKLQEGVSEGIGIDKLAGRIDELYLQHIIPYRSEVISRTEVIAASNLGSRAGAMQTGLELRKEWIATRDGRTREDHAAADGRVTEMNQPYVVGGEKLLFPGDTSFGASAENIIQCRCTEGYYRKGSVGTPRPTRNPAARMTYPSVHQAVRSEEENIWSLSKERAVVIAQDGQIVFRKDGTKTRVGFTHDEMLQMFGHRLTHNHPSHSSGSPGGSLSFADIVCMRKAHLKEVRAVDNYARYSIKPPRGGWGNITEYQIKDTYMRHHYQLKPYYQNELNSGRITFTEYVNEYTHEVVRKTAQELDMRYRRTPWLGDGRLRGKGWFMIENIKQTQPDNNEDIAFILDDTPMVSPVCDFCKHETGHRTCAAFPDQIPDEIWNGENKHAKPYQGDHGIQFESR